MDRRPLIGIVPGYDRDRDRLFTARNYVDGVTGAGGLPFILPLELPGDMAEQVTYHCDGFIFTGGPDIDARIFGEENMRYQGAVLPQRDEMELALAKLAVREKKAVLGICRGIQLLNVAVGGTLYQDIYSERDAGIMLKHWQDAPDWYPIHDVEIDSGSRLYQIFGTCKLPVNSYHHQAVKEPGKMFAVTARTSDGIVEALEFTDDQFIMAVQWHPEMMWKKDRQHLKLFEALVEAAAGRG